MGWRIGEILVQKKLLTWEELQIILDEQKESKKMIGEILVEKELISNFFLYQALAEQYKLRFVDLEHTHINPKAVEMVPQELSERYRLIPIEIRTGKLILGISNPLNIWPESEIRQLTGMTDIQTVLCLPDQIEKAVREEYVKLGTGETA